MSTRLVHTKMHSLTSIMLKTTMLIALFISFSPSVIANTINGIRVWPSPDETRVVLDMADEPVFSYFSLTKPDRLVVDIREAGSKAKLPMNVKNSNILTNIRKSTPSENGGYRLVFETKKLAVIDIFKLDPVPDTEYGYRLVVDFKNADPSEIAPPPPVENPVTAKPTQKPLVPVQAEKPVARQSVPQPKIHLPNRVVVAIDPGHGGNDPGSIGRARNYEKNITLAISKKIAARLNATPYIHAVLTRNNDYFVNLNRRTEIARKNKALLFVSIHADSYTTSGPSGGSVFVLSTRRANTEIGRWVVKKEEQSELLGGGGVLLSRNNADKNVSQTVLDLQFSHSQTEGNKLAIKVLQEMGKVTKLHHSKPIYASLAVLKSPDIPSILVETGFLSNPKEEKLLTQRYHQDKLAKAVADAIVKYFKANPPDGVSLSSNRSNMTNAGGLTHKVTRGEALSVIAQQYNTTTSNLMKLNNLKSASLQVGQVLVISKAQPKASAPSRSSNSSATTSTTKRTKVVTHVVQSGEYLGLIAQKYNTSTAAIKRQNNLTRDTVILGQKLSITQVIEVKMINYTVKSGDFLGKIAENHGVTVKAISDANNLRSNTIAVGQKLVIPQ